MIATITLNPAIDKTMNIGKLNLGEVNRMDSVRNIAGGKGINVTKVLRQYNYDVKALGLLGNNSGQIISDCLMNIGALDALTRVPGDVRTSTNIVSDDGMVTELLEPGPDITETDRLRFFAEYEKNIKDCEYVIISGSAPKGILPDVYEDLTLIAKTYGVKVILDASGENLKSGIKAKPYMIKPNLKELTQLTGIEFDGFESIAKTVTDLIKSGIPNVLVSMGADGIIYGKYEAQSADVDEDKLQGKIKIVKVSAPKLEVVNSVGSGDSAVAAFAMADSEGLRMEDIAKKCVAISAANVLTLENGVIDMEAAAEIEKNLKIQNSMNIEL